MWKRREGQCSKLIARERRYTWRVKCLMGDLNVQRPNDPPRAMARRADAVRRPEWPGPLPHTNGSGQDLEARPVFLERKRGSFPQHHHAECSPAHLPQRRCPL
ncbi:hypothetical protein CEXT_516011 [Caerostris extrusa]|uniref:Uncharacterized protein n=1 Tax=Caerostris extrusa TaxID=172846 RepID=A0AAV4UHB3_CAEEX|nr:hypothetical protein CEXT_516011 [Caerostris extrusa]